MNTQNEKIIEIISDLNCSICQKDFDENSLKFIEKYGNSAVYHLKCDNCGKDFGNIVITQKD